MFQKLVFHIIGSSLINRMIFRFSLAVLLASCAHSYRNMRMAFKEYKPLPSTTVLWTQCSEIPIKKEGKIYHLEVAGHQYKKGKMLGEGGGGKVYDLNSSDPHAPQLVLKETLSGSLKSLYDDILMHSTLQILGLPTTKAGLGFTFDAENKKKYLLIKEKVTGNTIAEGIYKQPIYALNFFSNQREKDKMHMTQLAKIISRMINSGFQISDLHTHNFMIDQSTNNLVIVDATIQRGQFRTKANPKENFGHSLGFRNATGDKIFYERYYLKDEPGSSPEAVEVAKKRTLLYFRQPTKSGCGDYDEIEHADGFDIDANRVFMIVK